MLCFLFFLTQCVRDTPRVVEVSTAAVTMEYREQESDSSMGDEEANDGGQTPSWPRTAILDRTLESESESESEMPPFVPLDHSTPRTVDGGKETNEATEKGPVKRDYSIEGYYQRHSDNRREWKRLTSRRSRRVVSPKPSTSAVPSPPCADMSPQPSTSTVRRPTHRGGRSHHNHNHKPPQEKEEGWESIKECFNAVICFFFSSFLFAELSH